MKIRKKGGKEMFRGVLNSAALASSSVIFDISADELMASVPSCFLGEAGGERLPQALSWDGQVWTRKQDFHITVLNFGGGLNKAVASQRGISEGSAKQIVRNAVQEAVKTFRSGELRRIEFTGNIRRLRRDNDESLIGMCMVGESASMDLVSFYRNLAAFTKTSCLRPPLHITLYTLPGQKGIGVNSEALLDRFTIRDWDY